MNITDIKIRKIFTEGKVRAVVSIILDGDFAVHDLKVIEGVERLFVAMPNRRSEDGRFQDIVHPISTEARTQLETVVLEKYKEAVEAAEAAEPVEPAETENSNEGEIKMRVRAKELRVARKRGEERQKAYDKAKAAAAAPPKTRGK